ncbi:hypothetical protein JCM24511_01824 [Saitozyma sp. JCM 24511]|jgi:hypothetical protein|nr:hypothetical protein JCM24511_01824 [Saitozyma sp. JCM 24511]
MTNTIVSLGGAATVTAIAIVPPSTPALIPMIPPRERQLQLRNSSRRLSQYIPLFRNPHSLTPPTFIPTFPLPSA